MGTWLSLTKNSSEVGGMPGVAALTPARFALKLSADFRTTPGLIFFYSSAGRIAVMLP